MKKSDIIIIADEYTQTRNARLKLDNDSKKLKVKEDSLLDKLVAAKVPTGVYGSFVVAYEPKKAPRVTDWTGFHAYILQSGNIDMLTKHLTPTAILARIDEGEYVPGVVVDDKPTYKITGA